jgi:hypothetical protein
MTNAESTFVFADEEVKTIGDEDLTACTGSTTRTITTSPPACRQGGAEGLLINFSVFLVLGTVHLIAWLGPTAVGDGRAANGALPGLWGASSEPAAYSSEKGG